MESPITTVKTEVEEAEEEEFSTNWINTNQSCFLCLQYSTEVKVIHLRSLLGHLQIHEQEVYTDNDGNSRPVRKGEWDDILVDLCKSCGASHFRLYTLLEQLKEIQMEIDNILEETNKSISESGRNRKLEESFFAKLSSNPRTPFNSEFVDNLRKRIAMKCKIMLSGQQIDIASESGIHEDVFDNGNESSKDADSSSHQMQMLNTTAISVAEEPSAHISTHSAASSVPQPRRSLRRRKQEALLEKKSPSAISSGQKSDDEVVASTSKCQETQTCEGNTMKSSSMCRRKSKYTTKNSITGLFQCRKCDKKSSWDSTIRSHYKSAHLKITHPCDICNVAVFTCQQHLIRHQLTCQRNLEKRQAREKEPKFRFECEICGKRFDKNNGLSKHRLVVHKNVDRYPCELCDKKFKTNSNLIEHKDAVHFGKKKSCKFCKKLYGSGSRSLLKKHENSCKAKTVDGLTKQA